MVNSPRLHRPCDADCLNHRVFRAGLITEDHRSHRSSDGALDRRPEESPRRTGAFTEDNEGNGGLTTKGRGGYRLSPFVRIFVVFVIFCNSSCKKRLTEDNEGNEGLTTTRRGHRLSPLCLYLRCLR